MPRRFLAVTVALAMTAACSRTSPVAPAITSSSSVSVTDNTTQVSGRVYAGSGVSDAPLADADVVVTSGASSASTRTGSLGEYSLTVRPGAATITASKRGYQSKTWSIEVADNLVVNFALASQ